MKSPISRLMAVAMSAVLMLASLAAGAATLTPQQRTTLQTAIAGNGTALAFKQAGDTVGLRSFLNAAAPGPVLAWSIAIAPQTLDEAATYTTYDSLTQGKRDEWVRLLSFTRSFGKNKNRNVVTDVWGAATASSIAEAVLQAGTESATWAQNALGGTVKTTGTVSATDRNYTGTIDQDDVTWLVNN